MKKCCEDTIRKCADIVLNAIPHPLTIICSTKTRKEVADALTPMVSMMFRIKDDIIYLIPSERLRIDQNRERERKRAKASRKRALNGRA